MPPKLPPLTQPSRRGSPLPPLLHPPPLSYSPSCLPSSYYRSSVPLCLLLSRLKIHSSSSQDSRPGAGTAGSSPKLQLAAGLPPTVLMEAAAEGGAAGGQQQQAVHDVWV